MLEKPTGSGSYAAKYQTDTYYNYPSLIRVVIIYNLLIVSYLAATGPTLIPAKLQSAFGDVEAAEGDVGNAGAVFPTNRDCKST